MEEYKQLFSLVLLDRERNGLKLHKVFAAFVQNLEYSYKCNKKVTLELGYEMACY